VDPHRDNPARLRAYLSNFDPSFVGMTGSPQAIAAIAEHYGVHYQVEGSQQTDTYLIAHTGYVYLLDRRGTVRYLFPLDAPLDVLIHGVQALEHS
ncbi:MAG TPA: SCO family protein, partial [bacterium]|nr:SCO family protein [bacterium]